MARNLRLALAKNLQRLRREQGLSQEAFAEREERMITGKLSGKDPSQQPFWTVNRTNAPARVPRMSSRSKTRTGILILLRVLGRSRSEVAPYARMRPENS